MKRFVENLANTIPFVRDTTIWIGFLVISLLIISFLIWKRKGFKEQLISRIENQNSDSKKLLLTIAFAFLLPCLMMATLSYRVRYTTPYLPMAWVLYGVGLSVVFEAVKQQLRLRWRFGQQAVIAALLVLLIIPSAKEAIALGSMDKSGVRALVAEEKTKDWQHTIYILSPDGTGPSFGYYFRGFPVTFKGFARWEDPQIFSPQGYAAIWQDPALLKTFETNIQSISQQGFKQIALIHEKGTLRDSGSLKISRANPVPGILAKHYRLREQKAFSGYMESVELSVFDISNDSTNSVNSSKI